MKKSLAFLIFFFITCAAGQVRPALAQNPLNIGSEFTMPGANPNGHDDVWDQTDEEEGRKSPALAAVYSLLLPGMGELYAGNYGMGKFFTIAEGGLVIALIGMDRYANWLQDDARDYAVRHAQAHIDGKDDRFYNALGNFNSVDLYNEQVLRSRDPEKAYDPSPNSSYYWRWDNSSNREEYRDLRVSSDERFNDTRFIAAAIGVNHVVSAINAARIAFTHNKSLQHSNTFDIHADVMGGFAHPNGVMITLTRSF